MPEMRRFQLFGASGLRVGPRERECPLPYRASEPVVSSKNRHNV